jgi:hypothetical protein
VIALRRWRARSGAGTGRAITGRAKTRGERGQALVEFALMMPLLALLLFTLLDFGRVYSGMTIFVDRGGAATVNIQPASKVQCATVAAAGSAQGCIGGISGTIYAANDNSVVNIKAAGTANLQILSGMMLITNGSTAHFTFNSAGFAASAVTISLVE